MGQALSVFHQFKLGITQHGYGRTCDLVVVLKTDINTGNKINLCKLIAADDLNGQLFLQLYGFRRT